MDSRFFTNNRRALVDQVDPEGVYFFTAYDALQRSHDMAHRFTQESNYWYLAGIEEAGWLLVIDGTARTSWLIKPRRDEVHVLFDGGMTSDQARVLSGVDDVLTADEGEALVRKYKDSGRPVYSLGPDPYSDHYDFTQNPAPVRLWSRLMREFSCVEDTRLALARLRAVKQPAEITAIRSAINITNDAFQHVKQMLPSMRYEYEIEAEFSYYFRKHGAAGHAYEPIVASGEHACTLHYSQNNDELKSDSLVLLDIGASVGGYAADITRTYAIGNPLARAREVHGAVARAQREIISTIKPGLLVADYHAVVDTHMKQALVDVKLLSSHDDEETYRRYFPHAISHGLGLDVHDSLGRTLQFQSGMVLTVEPGIYIPEEGIGVRLEDDILVTDDGHENMSESLSLNL